MSIIINNKEDKLVITVVDNSAMIDHIPGGIYTISVNPMTGAVNLHKDAKRFNVPERIYGKTHPKRLSLITDEYKSRENALGVILYGLKGSGKSLLAESIANNMISMDIPVFKVDSAVPPHILTLVAKVAGKSLFYFDEYAKVYNEPKEQSAMLTFFSDTSLKQTMFLVCDNTIHHFNEYIIDRPGRFLFRINYTGLDRDAVEEMCSINGLPDIFTDEIVSFSINVPLSVDVISTLVRFAKRCDTVNELNEYMHILNIPKKQYSKLKHDLVFSDNSKRSPYSFAPSDNDLSARKLACVISRVKNKVSVELHRLHVNEDNNDITTSLIDVKTASYLDIVEACKSPYSSDRSYYVHFADASVRLDIVISDKDNGDTYVLVDERNERVEELRERIENMKERFPGVHGDRVVQGVLSTKSYDRSMSAR